MSVTVAQVSEKESTRLLNAELNAATPDSSIPTQATMTPTLETIATSESSHPVSSGK